MSRSAAEQVNHWARIGRELELSAHVRHRDVARVLSGTSAYDDLEPREQAVVRAAWSERAHDLRSELDLESEFRAAGRSWSELDADGNVVTRGGDGS